MAYEWEGGMGDVYNGGAHENECRAMIKAGADWNDAPGGSPTWSGMDILFASNNDGQLMLDAVAAQAGTATGAEKKKMCAIAVRGAQFIKANDWATFVTLMTPA